MSKELEALSRLANTHTLYIENEYHIVDDYNLIEKSLKALEIIKKKIVVLYDKKQNNGKYLFIIGIKTKEKGIDAIPIYSTKKKTELDLLKEVLL